MTRPLMPSSPAMVVAVAAWSPVIMCTAMPAAWHFAIAVLASGRGGSTIPTMASSTRSSRRASRSSSGSTSVRSKSLPATASTRRPWPPRTRFASAYRACRSGSNGTGPAGQPGARASRASTSGAPLTKQRTTSRPSPAVHRWKVADSLYAESNGTSARRGRARRAAVVSMPPFSASTANAPSVGSPTSCPSRRAASLHSAIATRASWSGGTGSPSVERTCPLAVYPSPLTVNVRSAACSTRAVIWLRVSVPVLSVQMCEVQPSVSTAASRLTIAPWRASRVAPMARVNATTAGRPSGMVATARDTAVRNSSVNDWPRSSPRTKTTSTTAPASAVSVRASWSIWRCSGVRSDLAPASNPAMAPIWVPVPVAVTTKTARPRVTMVFMKTMSMRSASGVPESATAAVSLATGSDSPVRVASCTSSAITCSSRPSAGTRSPASITTTSPGTRSAASSSSRTPSRRTRHRASVMSRNASRLASALRSCTKLMAALNTTTARITTGVSHSRDTAALTAAATMRTTTSRSWNGRSMARQTGSWAASGSRFGPNRLPDAAREPVWRALLRPFQDLLVLVLIVAAAVSAAVSREWETPVVILLVVVLNAAINFVQERKAEASLQALRDMTVARCQVRRDGGLFELDAADLVPGDVVVIEAGDRVPAEGRLLQVIALEVQEATLTGESEPIAKDTAAVADSDAPLADRIDMVFMNTVVTRGRAVFVVTATGTGTQMGAIAGLLASAKSERTPLQRQINQLARTLTELAGAVVLVVFVLGLLRGQSFSELFLTARDTAVRNS